MASPIPVPFIDFYDVLQIGRNAEPETIHRVYRILAAKLHPDNGNTGDLDSFVLLNRAYEVLSNPESRSIYDTEYEQAGRGDRSAEIEAETRDYAVGLDAESTRRLNILCLLYGKRKTDAESPSISLLELEQKMGAAREDLLFAIWYLREKDYVRLDERSSLLITATGVDHVEKNLPSSKLIYKLLKAAPGSAVNHSSGLEDAEPVRS